MEQERQEAERQIREVAAWRQREYVEGRHTVRLTTPSRERPSSAVAKALLPLLHATPNLRKLKQAEVKSLIEAAFHIEPQLIAEDVSQGDAVALKKAVEERGGRVRITERRAQEGGANRAPIPAGVRREVWRRDDGRCVDCGSRERLEYDHIIPVSKGGSNTARNIELRCEPCNRKKGAQI